MPFPRSSPTSIRSSSSRAAAAAGAAANLLTTAAVAASLFAVPNLEASTAFVVVAPPPAPPATLPSLSLSSSSSRPRPFLPSALFAKKGGGKKKKTKKPSQASSGMGGGGGGGGGGFGTKKPAIDSSLYERALKAKLKEVRSYPSSSRKWLELGSVLVKLGDYAEAEEVFRLGDSVAAPNDEMLRGAYVALAGHSSRYFGGKPSKDVDPNALECPFDVYDVNQPAENFRTVSWTDRNDDVRVQASRGPLLPKDECARAIEIAEAHASERGGWTSSRHTQAATTDVPVKDIPELLDWFNDKLETTLFPMLAARYPDKIRSAEDLRAHDAFVVKYDAEGRQNSLVTHVDESAFSFTIALNDRDEYEGGGTCFESIKLRGGSSSDDDDGYEPLVLNADAGGVVAFPGTIRHGGSPVTRGVRYIVPLFLYLHENRTGKEKGYVSNELKEAAEKARRRQRLVSSSSSSSGSF